MVFFGFNVTCTLSFNIWSNFALLSRDFDDSISSVLVCENILNSSIPRTVSISGLPLETEFFYVRQPRRHTRLYINMCLLIFRSHRKKRNEGKGATTAANLFFFNLVHTRSCSSSAHGGNARLWCAHLLPDSLLSSVFLTFLPSSFRFCSGLIWCAHAAV